MTDDLADVRADGLDGSLDERIPGLLGRLAHGNASERYDAAYLLIAWDEPTALATLARWARRPAELPRETGNRFTGGDASFGPLAESLGAGGGSPRAASSAALRVEAGRALLERVVDEDFERHLSLALGWDELLRQALADDIAAAAERAVASLEGRRKPSFDLWTQAAGLLYPLGKERDATAADLARRLIKRGRRDRRMLLEVVDALAAASGPATYAVLLELRDRSRLRDVREAAGAAAERRAR